MRTFFLTLCLFALASSGSNASALRKPKPCSAISAGARKKPKPHAIPATKYGAKGDGRTVNTAALNKAIAATPDGDTLLIPAGRYVTGTLHLKSHITIVLETGAEIVATPNLDDYDHYRPTKDMTRYDTGAGTVNANLTRDARWTRALILGQNLRDVTITGAGTIDGQHLEDPLGEESMRGPHTIIIAESDSVRINGIAIRRASNYAVLGYELTNSEFRGLDIEEGWDGIHIRGGENLLIADCDINTGDDAIAGGYWTNMTITRCRLNSSCNGIRMIEPSTNLLISRCHIYGPGLFPHRTSREQRRTGTLYGIVLEPGAWGDAPGHTENVTIKDVTIDNLLSPLVYSMSDNNTCSGLLVDNLRATRISYNTVPLNRQNTVRMWDNIEIRGYSISMPR